MSIIQNLYKKFRKVLLLVPGCDSCKKRKQRMLRIMDATLGYKPEREVSDYGMY